MTLDEAIKCLEGEIERALAYRTVPKGGMQVPFHGDFAQVPVSGLCRLQWHVRNLKSAADETQKQIDSAWDDGFGSAEAGILEGNVSELMEAVRAHIAAGVERTPTGFRLVAALAACDGENSEPK